METPEEKIQIIEIPIEKVPMSWYDETSWVQMCIEIMFGFGTLFPIVTLPLFILLGVLVISNYSERAEWAL